MCAQNVSSLENLWKKNCPKEVKIKKVYIIYTCLKLWIRPISKYLHKLWLVLIGQSNVKQYEKLIKYLSKRLICLLLWFSNCHYALYVYTKQLLVIASSLLDFKFHIYYLDWSHVSNKHYPIMRINYFLLLIMRSN